MDWYHSVTEMIDLRSFSNLWYWIALAVMWSTASHWILGVPFDLVQRAARQGGRAEADLETLVRIHLDRIFYVVKTSGVWLAGLTAAIHTTLVILGFVYDVEFAQAVFFLAFPMTIITGLNLWTGKRIRSDDARGALLRKALSRHRRITQAIGVISITVTSFYGMMQNMTVVNW